MSTSPTPDVETVRDQPVDAPEVPWRRLDRRMIWVDGARSALSLVPSVLAVAVFGVEPSLSSMWPVLLVAVVGVGGAIDDALRWVKTRYRITDDYVERRTGLLFRQYRSIRRDRIRSVDTVAKLRHRLAGLRLVTIGAGQQTATGEAALSLDAVGRATAENLRRELLHETTESVALESGALESGAPDSDGLDSAGSGSAATPEASDQPAPDAEQLIARLRWRWLLYNIVNIWAYLAAAGLLWGGYWIGQMLGVNLAELVAGLLDWERLGWGWTIPIAAISVGAAGVIMLAGYFVAENWNFRLSRVRSEHGSMLRTSQGLFTTRVVNRDDNRLRGVAITEPLFWRWIHAADTEVITTGLAAWEFGENSPRTILPRCSLGQARRVAATVLADDRPLSATLPRHPRAALVRRLVWAVLATVVGTAGLAWLSTRIDSLTTAIWPVLLGLLAAGLGCAVLAYRALGHAIVGDYLVFRGGVVWRQTAALRRPAVSGWCFRQSVLQRRLGLLSIAATTAAGEGAYYAFDLDATEGVEFADRAVPGLLTPFLATPATTDDPLPATPDTSQREGEHQDDGD